MTKSDEAMPFLPRTIKSPELFFTFLLYFKQKHLLMRLKIRGDGFALHIPPLNQTTSLAPCLPFTPFYKYAR